MLPSKILNVFSLSEIKDMANSESGLRDYLSDPYRSLWMWLLDFAVEVLQNHTLNKITARSLGIYF